MSARLDDRRPCWSSDGEPWAPWLRPGASKSIVVVTDDNARLSADQFETFAGGQNPFNTTTLPPGILSAAHAGMFDGYLFDGWYGWGSESNTTTTCQYAGGGNPASAGPVYSALVSRTGGVRSQICSTEGWQPFAAAVAAAAAKASRIDCKVALPSPELSGGLLLGIDVVESQTTTLADVGAAGACTPSGGFYREDQASVTLCPASCSLARPLVGPRRSGSIQARYGCPWAHRVD
jgi:hypothetical protein